MPAYATNLQSASHNQMSDSETPYLIIKSGDVIKTRYKIRAKYVGK